MATVVPLARARAIDRFGGKAAQLAVLCEVPGVRVPSGFAIDAAVFRAMVESTLPAGQWPERVLAGPAHERRGDRVAAIRERLLAGAIPEAAWREILAAYHALGAKLVAVRSSALHEDAEDASAAGIQETILGVDGEEALARAVKECFGSIYRERALEYLARQGRARPVAVAIVVQTLVDADAAGVLFTLDPLAREPGVMLVEATHGLGVAVVDGSIAPDVYRVDRATGAVRGTTLGDKRFAMRARGNSIERVSSTPEEVARPALDAAQLRALAEAGLAVERAMGGARDIEWAFERNTLWLLQSRPIVGSKRDGDDRASWVWSNVNVGEALPGVATPLTWSVGAAFSEQGFRRAFGALGCTVPEGTELVGQFHGRIYLNLTAFMRIAAQIPALDPKLLLEFGGGGGLEMLEAQVEKGSWAAFLLRAPIIGARYLAENAALSRRLDTFEREFAEERRTFESAALSERTPAELGAWLDRLTALLDRTGAVMLTCASGHLSSVVALRALLHLACREDATRLEQSLLTGTADLESAAPGIALIHIAEQCRREPAARSVVERTDATELRAELLPEGPTRRAFEAFLRAYGYRAPREAELSNPRWREAPQILFATIKAQLERNDDRVLREIESQITVRDAAERELQSRLPPPARAAARHLLARTRRFMRLRERMRARVTEVLGFHRTLALEISARIRARDPSAGPDGAFFLRLDELQAYLRGELTAVAALIAARRIDVARDVAHPGPPPVFAGAPPLGSPPVVTTGDALVGIGASAGVAQGRARVLRDPAEGAALRPGEILVVPVADVGWTPLFLVASGVVTELGGALSHAALVAREYGVPTVVNAAGVTRAVNTGDMIAVDGARGTVTLVRHATDTPAESKRARD